MLPRPLRAQLQARKPLSCNLGGVLGPGSRSYPAPLVLLLRWHLGPLFRCLIQEGLIAFALVLPGLGLALPWASSSRMPKVAHSGAEGAKGLGAGRGWQLESAASGLWGRRVLSAAHVTTCTRRRLLSCRPLSVSRFVREVIVSLCCLSSD